MALQNTHGGEAVAVDKLVLWRVGLQEADKPPRRTIDSARAIEDGVDNRKDSHVNVVFVHGLTGDILLTWGAKQCRDCHKLDLSHFWPKALAEELQKEKATFWVAGYEAPLLERFHHGKMEQLFQEEGAAALKALARQNGGLERDKAIIFVAHSLGGLLVKAILASSHEHREEKDLGWVAQKTRAVVFLGTPHAGSRLVSFRGLVPLIARWGAKGLVSAVTALLAFWRLGTLVLPLPGGNLALSAAAVGTVITALLAGCLGWLLRPSRHVALLRENSPELWKLANDYRRVVRNYAPTTIAFYEGKGTFLSLRAVPRWSADPGVTDCEPAMIDASHIAMCKYSHKGPITDQIRDQVREATRGTETAVFGKAIKTHFENDPDILLLVKKRDFSAIPTYAENEEARKVGEKNLRGRLRELIKDDKLEPTPAQLEAAQESKFDVDKFVWEIWYERTINETLTMLRSRADLLRGGWAAVIAKGAKPSLIPFYRALRTIEHAYAGDFFPPSAREGSLIQRQELWKTVTDALKEVESQRKGLATRGEEKEFDGNAKTRWLLLRMDCALRALDAAYSSIGNPELEGPESQERAREREQRRQRFDAAFVAFSQALKEDLGAVPEAQAKLKEQLGPGV